jgi:hypothetical protein
VPLSFTKDIRPLFREIDIDHMKGVGGFDLSKLEDVRARADRILQRLAAGTMPPDKPWPADRVAKFQNWIGEGMQP